MFNTNNMVNLNNTHTFLPNVENDNLHDTFIAIGVFAIFLLVFGLIENLCVLYVFVKYKPMPVSNNNCLIWLTLVDNGLTIFGIPILIGSSFAKTWPYGLCVCEIYGFVMTFGGISQIAILDLIAIDKYLVIVKQNQILTKDGKFRTAAIMCCFGCGLMWAVFPLIGWSSFTYEGLNISCSVNWGGQTISDMSYSLSLIVFAWVVPLTIMIFCYGNIIILLRREARKPFRRHLTDSQKKKQQNRDRSVAITVLFIIGSAKTRVAFITSWMPYSIVSLVTIIGEPETIPPTVTMVPALLAKSSIIWNPIIYFVRHNDFRRECLKLLPGWCSLNAYRHYDRANKPSPSRSITRQILMENHATVRDTSEHRTPLSGCYALSLSSNESTMTNASQGETKTLFELKHKRNETEI